MTCMSAMDFAFSLDVDFISQRARTVYLFLAKLSNKENACFPSIATIARRCVMSESTVRRALADLIAMGLVLKASRRRKDNGDTSNLYTLIDPGASAEPESEVKMTPHELVTR